MIVFLQLKCTHIMIILCQVSTNLLSNYTVRHALNYLLWKASGKPRAGLLYLNMCQSGIRFKRTLREYRQNKEIIRANAHANSFMKKTSLRSGKVLERIITQEFHLHPWLITVLVIIYVANPLQTIA